MKDGHRDIKAQEVTLRIKITDCVATQYTCSSPTGRRGPWGTNRIGGFSVCIWCVCALLNLAFRCIDRFRFLLLRYVRCSADQNELERPPHAPWSPIPSAYRGISLAGMSGIVKATIYSNQLLKVSTQKKNFFVDESKKISTILVQYQKSTLISNKIVISPTAYLL